MQNSKTFYVLLHQYLFMIYVLREIQNQILRAGLKLQNYQRKGAT